MIDSGETLALASLSNRANKETKRAYCQEYAPQVSPESIHL